MFFAISGFLITSLMIRERLVHGRINLAHFYIRRSLRIFPLYYAVILLYIVAVLVFERHTATGVEFFKNLPAFLTYTSNWFVNLDSGERVIFYFAWSLAVEEQFYLTWPWIEKYVRAAPRNLLLVVLILIVVANRLGWLLWIFPEAGLAHRIIWYIAPSILLGVLSAHVMHDRRGFAIVNAALGRRWSAPAVLAVIALLLSVPLQNQAWEMVIYASLVALVLACTVREDNGLARLLQINPLVRIGVVSYGIYLMHMLCLNATRKIGAALDISSPWITWTAGVILVYVVAEISFHTFERFFLRFKRRYSAAVQDHPARRTSSAKA